MPSLLVKLRVIVRLSYVIKAAKVADPPRSIVDELDKWVDVSSTLTAPNQRFLVEGRCGDFFATWQLSERLDQEG